MHDQSQANAVNEADAAAVSAREATESAAAYESRFARIDSDLAVLKGMMAFNLANTVAVLFLPVRR